MTQLLAPIALFTFKRPKHTELALRSLLANPEVANSPLYIFCDGPRDAGEVIEVLAAREVVRALAPGHAVILEREVNLGLDRSIVSGVTELCERYGRVIVIEDDLEVAPDFLAYMNAALKEYEFWPEIMQISGYQFPVEIPGGDSAMFLPYVTSWGWATWQRAWNLFDVSAPAFQQIRDERAQRKAFDLEGSFPYFKMLRRNLEKPFPAWDIVFYSNVFSLRRLALHPRVSLVRNNGFDGSGSTCGNYATEVVSFASGMDSFQFPIKPQIDQAAYMAVKKYLRKESSAPIKILRRIQARLS